MKKKLLVYHYRYLPPSETFIYSQLLSLGESWDMDVLTHELDRPEKFPGITPILLPPEGRLGRWLRREPRSFARRLAGKDLLHVNFGHYAVKMLPYAQAANVPLTAYFHGVDASACLRRPAYVEALRNSRFRAVVTCSAEMQSRLRPYLPERTEYLVSYCGTRTGDFVFRPRRTVPDGALFLQVGRLDYKKGFDETLRAFSRYLAEVDAGARLRIAGDGPLAMELRTLAEALRISGKVHFLGAISHSEVVAQMHAADVFIHPSKTAPDGDMEGIPVTLCEAMATGLPVISTRHSGIPELIDHGVDGLLATEGDAQDLFEQMRLLREMNVERLSQAARQKVEARFDARANGRLLAERLARLV